MPHFVNHGGSYHVYAFALVPRRRACHWHEVPPTILPEHRPHDTSLRLALAADAEIPPPTYPSTLEEYRLECAHEQALEEDLVRQRGGDPNVHVLRRR